jgi:uncharacterized protein (DUF58 family)
VIPRSVFPPIWLSARGVWTLLGVALVISFASILPALLSVAVVAGVTYLALLAADFGVGPRATRLRLARKPVGFVSLRHPASLHYVIENRSGVGIRAGILESPVATFDFARDVVETDIAPRTFVDVESEFEPRERGLVHLDAIYWWAENRLGMLRRRYRVDAPEDVRVFPDLSAIERYGKLARRSTLLDLGLRKLRLRGVGAEFESLREYLPGDAFRSVNWKATARRGRMMVEQYDVERSQNVLVLLDAGRLMTPRIGPQRKFDYALTAGLSVASIAQAAGDNVGLTAFASKPLLSIAPRRGAAHVDALTRASYDLQPRLEEPDYETIFTQLKQRHSKRSLVVLFTDIFDPATSAAVLAGLSMLVSRHLVMCVLMNDAAIAAALETKPTSARDAYRTSVAMALAAEREKSIALLRGRGIIVIDVPAPKLTVALLDAYLDVKARGLL